MTTTDPHSHTTDITYCHFDRGHESTLRCNRCDKPICAKCAIRTPTGYRCRECVKSQRAKFITIEWYDYITAAVVSLILSFIGIILIGFATGLIRGFFSFIIIFMISPAIGGAIAEAVRMAVRRRRGPYLAHVVVAGIILSGLPSLLLGGGLFSIIYMFMASSTVVARLRGLSI